MSDNIKLYKLISGQEIVGKVVEEGIGWFVLEHILAIQIRPTGPDSYQIGFAGFSAASPDGKWKCYSTQLFGEALTVPPDLKNAYIKQTSGIEIVSSMGMIK